MDKKATRTFKVALKSTRLENDMSLLDLGLAIESDASHIFKIERGQDVTLSTILRLANALGVSVEFGRFKLTSEPSMKTRRRKKPDA